MIDLRELLASTVATLDELGAQDEALAVIREPRGFSVFKSRSAMVPVGRAWRLGVLLLNRELQLFETGEVTRAIEPLIAVTNRSQAAEDRREFRRMAARGPFPAGETINHGWHELPLDIESLRVGSGPLSIDGDTIRVRVGSAPGQGTAPLDRYLADRASLFGLD